MIKLNIAKEFSKTPGHRFKDKSDFSGEEFRDNLLIPRIQKSIDEDDTLVVEMDGGVGYSNGFLDESFGRLISKGNFSKEQLKEYIIIVSDEEPYLIHLIWKFIESNSLENSFFRG